MALQSSEPQTGGDPEIYYEWSRPELRALVPRDARVILDVGCGAGALGAALKEELPDATVHGLELFDDAAARAAERIDAVEVCDLDAVEALPEGWGPFDAIVCGDVLEHLRAPDRLLALLRDALAPGGVIVASIPNLKHWTVVFPLLVHDRFAYEDAGLLDRTHVHFFTLTEIDRMYSGLGLAVRHLGATTHPMPPELQPLADLAHRYGGDAAETAARLSAYQYLVVAGRADA